MHQSLTAQALNIPDRHIIIMHDSMKGQSLETLLMAVLSVVIFVILIATLVMPTIKGVDTSNFTATQVNDEKLTAKLIISASPGATYNITNTPLPANGIIRVYVNGTGAGSQVNMTSGNYTLTAATGAINFNTADVVFNNSPVNLTYDYKNGGYAWSGAEVATWGIVGLIVIIGVILFVVKTLF